MLTAIQQRVFAFIGGYIASNGQSPTFYEIGRRFELSSTASVAGIITALEREGLIKRTPNKARGLQLVPRSEAEIFES